MSKKSFGNFLKKATKTVVGFSTLYCISTVITFSIMEFDSVKQMPQIPQRFKGVDKSLFIQNSFGMPYMLPIKNGMVELNILNQFTEKQQKEIKTGIMELDDLAKGFNYTVSESNTHKEKAINIELVPYSKDHSIATANSWSRIWGTTINYPITITFNENVIKTYSVDLTQVIKHELLHTLGFNDLYDKEDMDHVMYYQAVGNSLNDEEINALNTVYDGKYTGLYKAGKPTSVNYVYHDETENKSSSNETTDETTLQF